MCAQMVSMEDVTLAGQSELIIAERIEENFEEGAVAVIDSRNSK